MQRAAWARWRSRVYFLAVFRIALSKFHPIFAQIGHLPQNLRQPREIPKYGTYLPLGPSHGGTPTTLVGDSYVYGTYGFTEAKEKGRDGTPRRGGSRVPCEARPSWATGRHPAGYTAPAQVTKVKTPFFNDLVAITSLSIRPHFAFIIIVLQRAACRVLLDAAKCKT